MGGVCIWKFYVRNCLPPNLPPFAFAPIPPHEAHRYEIGACCLHRPNRSSSHPNDSGNWRNVGLAHARPDKPRMPRNLQAAPCAQDRAWRLTRRRPRQVVSRRLQQHARGRARRARNQACSGQSECRPGDGRGCLHGLRYARGRDRHERWYLESVCSAPRHIR